MPPVEMTHAVFGTRVVKDSQVDSYRQVGWEKGAEVAPEPVAAPMRQVLADVGDDPEAARTALLAEQSRPSPRKNLVTALARIAEPTENQEN